MEDKMHLKLEWTHATIRGGKEYLGHGSDYELVLTVLRYENTAKIVAALGRIDRNVVREIRKMLIAEGITEAEYIRPNGKVMKLFADE